jgi:hypothetical protein
MSRSTGTQQQKSGPAGGTVEVTIIYDGRKTNPQEKITVKPNVFWVSKGDCEQVHWHCESQDPALPAPEFTIDFNKNGSPFNETLFNHQVPFSGLVRRGVLPDAHKIYGYTVQIGDESLDPGGGVRG